MSTPELEQWLRKHGTDKPASTVPGIGPGGWNKHALANAQGQAGKPHDSLLQTKTLYRLYTENTLVLHRSDLLAIVGRYFNGATIYFGTGLDARTQADSEPAIVVEIVTSAVDSLQRIADLAGDLRVVGQQISVLVTRQTVDTFEVTA